MQLIRIAKRTIEVLLGLLLLIGGLVPIAGLLGLVVGVTTSDGIPWWGVWVIVVFAAGLASIAFTLGWRLVTGHERAGGGLVHPWLLYAAAVLFTWRGMSRRMLLGDPWGRTDLVSAAEALRLARSRRGEKRSTKNHAQ